MAVSPIETLNIPPDVAERLRERRPGYDEIAALLVEFKEIAGSKKAFDLSADDVAHMFVRPALKALGWDIHPVEESPFRYFHDEMSALLAEVRGLQVVVGARPIGLLSSERNMDTDLMEWAQRVGTDYGLLTNFGDNRIWRFSDELTLSRPVLEVEIQDYLADERRDCDLLAAEHFFDFVRSDESSPNIAKQMAQEAPETLKTTDDEAEPDIPLPELVTPYSEPDGPHQHFDPVIPGIAFQSQGTPRRTITAIVRDRENQKPHLLLAGGDLPAGAEIIQPQLDDGDSIGTVEKRLAGGEGEQGALAKLAGERSFLSMLPHNRPIAGVARPAENLPVCKFGGGTGYTCGDISQTQMHVTLTDDSGRDVLLNNAFMVAGQPFSGRGDVGAPVLTRDTHELIGVIVGYNEDGTVCLPIRPILEALDVDLVTEPVRYLRKHAASRDLFATNDLIYGEDRLGFSHYVKAFVSLITDKNTQPPLTIGIYGAWGTGKSFLMNKIACILRPDLCPDEEVPAGEPVVVAGKFKPLVVRFEAWDYNGSDKLWAGLVEQIFGALEKELGWYWQLKFNFGRNLVRQWRRIENRLLPYVLISIALAGLVVYFLLQNETARNAIAAGGATGILTFFVLLIPQLINLLSTSASQRVLDMFAAEDYKQDIGFMGRIRTDLKDFADHLPDNAKVVIFIDDLDRCDPKKAVEVLEATKLLLELKQFIVFLAIDARIITQAVEEHYGKVLTEAEITGYEYLDKIVQIPFSIPEPRPADVRNYLGSLMGLSAEQVVALETQISSPEPEPEFVAESAAEAETTEHGPEAADESEIEDRDRLPSEEKAPDEAEKPPEKETRTGAEVEAPLPDTPPSLTEQAFDTIEVAFTPDEQKAFLRFQPHLDPNPRRLKRLVNIYRLVRVLLRSQNRPDLARFVDETQYQHHVLAWLVLCEQWPYAAHIMLEVIDHQLNEADTEAAARRTLTRQTIATIYPTAKQRIAEDDNEALQKLDLKYEQLELFIKQHLADFSLADLRRLRPFTINFNPALSAEVRLTLAHQ